MKNVYIVEIMADWDMYYEIDEVFESKDKALDYAASYAVNHWSPDDNDAWQEEMEERHEYISQFDYARQMLDEGMEWYIRVGEYNVN